MSNAELLKEIGQRKRDSELRGQAQVTEGKNTGKGKGGKGFARGAAMPTECQGSCDESDGDDQPEFVQSRYGVKAQRREVDEPPRRYGGDIED